MVAFMIRDAVPADVASLRALFRRSSLSNAGDRANLLAHPDALELSDVAVTEGRTRVVTDIDGQIVGFVTVAPEPGLVELEDLFVDPEWMRRGIGRQLVLDAVASARRAGITRLEVTANHHASAFYRDVGFVLDHEVETRFGPAPRMCLVVAP